MGCERCIAKARDIVGHIHRGESTRWTCALCQGHWSIRMSRWRGTVRLRYWSAGRREGVGDER